MIKGLLASHEGSDYILERVGGSIYVYSLDRRTMFIIAVSDIENLLSLLPGDNDA